MRLLFKFPSTLLAAVGLSLLASCTSANPNAATVDSVPQTVAADEAPSEAEAVPSVTDEAIADEATSETEVATATTEVTPSEAEATAAAEATVAVAEEPAGVFAEGGVAIRGADPVAYFTEGGYVAGSASYTHEWGGATWQFASAENRDLFVSNPGAYAPQYGGFCAWAVSQGYTAPVDPTAWEIVDGKLYLNFDARIQRRWERDIPGNIASADQNWPAVLNN